MPLKDFIEGTVKLLGTETNEILVEQAKAFRNKSDPHPVIISARDQMRGLKSPLAVSRLRLSPYREVNARNSSRAASLNSFRGSIAASPLFINSCSSRTVRFGAR
jgi:hypothetical protein